MASNGRLMGVVAYPSTTHSHESELCCCCVRESEGKGSRVLHVPCDVTLPDGSPCVCPPTGCDFRPDDMMQASGNLLKQMSLGKDRDCHAGADEGGSGGGP